MSNLIKSAYFNVIEEREVRVIDSDSNTPVFVQGLFHQKKELREKEYPAELQAQEELLPEKEEEFQNGLNILSMDMILQQEKDKLTQELTEESEQMLDEARLRADQILESARQEADIIRQQAFAEGNQQGLERGKEFAQVQLKEEKERFQEEMKEQKKQLQEEIANLEPQFADILAALVEKLTGIVCQDKKEVIVYLIDRALQQAERTQSLTLRVSQEDLLTVTAKKHKLLQSVSEEVDFSLIEDASLTAGQCIIETDNKLLDCSLDVQLQNIQEQIKLLTTY